MLITVYIYLHKHKNFIKTRHLTLYYLKEVYK